MPNMFAWESPYISDTFSRESPKFQTDFHVSKRSPRHSKDLSGKWIDLEIQFCWFWSPPWVDPFLYKRKGRLPWQYSRDGLKCVLPQRRREYSFEAVYHGNTHLGPSNVRPSTMAIHIWTASKTASNVYCHGRRPHIWRPQMCIAMTFDGLKCVLPW